MHVCEWVMFRTNTFERTLLRVCVRYELLTHIYLVQNIFCNTCYSSEKKEKNTACLWCIPILLYKNILEYPNVQHSSRCTLSYSHSGREHSEPSAFTCDHKLTVPCVNPIFVSVFHCIYGCCINSAYLYSVESLITCLCHLFLGRSQYKWIL